MSSTVSVDRSGSRPAGRRSRKTSKKKAASSKGLRGFFQDRRLHLAIYFAFILLVGLTGGGSRPDILSLLGAYVYGDFCSGKILGLRYEGELVTDFMLLVDSGLSITSFGQDLDGNLYVLSSNEGISTKLRRDLA